MDFERNLKIFCLHVGLNTGTLVVFILLSKNEPLLALAKLYVLIILPLAYVWMGYRYVPVQGSFRSRWMSLSLITLLGIAVWSICLCLYITAGATASAKNSLFILPSEIVWIFYGAYNLLLYVPLIVLDFLSLHSEKELQGVEAAVGVLGVNMLPLLLMSLGAFLKKIRS